MTDTFTPDVGGATPAPAGAPAVTPSPPPAAPPSAPAPSSAPVGGADPFLDNDLPDQPVFDPGYVKDLRGRANGYRQQVRELEAAKAAYQVFDSYDPADRQVWIDLASTWQADPGQAAQMMQQIAAAVLTENGVEPPAAGAVPEAAPGAAPSTADLTPEAVQKMVADGIAAYQQQQNEAHAVEQVYSEVRAAGYDPATMDGFMVLWLANHETNGNIGEAVTKLKARDASVIDAYVQGKAGGHAGVAPSNGAVAASTPTEPTSWDNTRKAAQAFLNSRMEPGQA